MAWTGQLSTGAFFNTGVGIARIHGGIEYNVSRTDNTVYFTGTRAIIQYIRESGSWTSFTYGSGWTWRMHVNGQRTQNSTSGTRSVNAQDGGSYVNFSVGVSAGDTSLTGYVSAWFSGDGETYTGGLGISIPSLGFPSINSTSVTNIAVTSATINSSFSAGSNSSGISSVQVQYGLTTGYGKTASGTTANLTNLTPGSTYHYRFVVTNNGGRQTTTGDYTFTTLPAPNTSAALLAIVGVL